MQLDIRDNNNPISSVNNAINYLLIILLIFLQDSPYFLEPDVNKLLWVIILFFLLLIAIKRKKELIERKILLILLTTWFMIFVQYLIYGGGFTSAAVYKPVWIFYTTYLVYILLGVKYYKYLFNIIYFIAIYTSVIYVLQTFIPSFDTLLTWAFEEVFKISWADWPRTILIYSIPQESGYLLKRNSGLFHEAGAYGIYLILAIIVNTLFTKQPFNKRNLFLSAVLLTTFSTVSYVMLFLYYGYHIVSSKMHSAAKLALIVLFVLIASDVYTRVDFLKDKIYHRLEIQKYAVEDKRINVRGRFYAMMMSLQSFSESPIFGRGIIGITKYDVGETGSFGYGIGGMLARYGIIYTMIYLVYYYKGYKWLSTKYGFTNIHGTVVFIIVNIGLFTQIFFFHTPFIYPLYLAIYKRSKRMIE
jgi:hypothetical protein